MTELRRLTSLRWFAAFAVFASHVGLHRQHLNWLVPAGPIGVCFFFILSGFVLAWSSPAGDTARSFYRRRFARIYPATAASVLVAIVLWSLSVPNLTVTPRGVVATLTLTQSWFPQWHPLRDCNRVTWSLACEAFFYLLFPVLLRLGRIAPRVLLWMSGLGVFAGFVLTVALQTEYTYYCPAARLPEFGLGVALGVLVKNGMRPSIHPGTAFAMFGLGCGLAAATANGYSQVHACMAVPGVAAILLSAAAADLAGVEGVLTSAPAHYLGQLSFCFYLTHYLALQTVSIEVTNPALLALAGFPVAFASAAALHHWVELPMQRRISKRRRVEVRTPPRETTISAVA